MTPGVVFSPCLVEQLAAEEFDAVATDMSLPGMDGIALLKHIREEYDELPVILITGYGSVGSAEHGVHFSRGRHDTESTIRIRLSLVAHHQWAV